MGKSFAVKACVDGQIIPLQQVADPVFAQKLTGDGLAILPSSEKFVAPVDGVVRMVFSAKHSVVIETKEGFFILVHIGTNTLSLNGQGFNVLVEQGDFVNLGQPIIEIDPAMLKDPKLDYTTVVLVMNNHAYKMMEKTTEKISKSSETVLFEVSY